MFEQATPAATISADLVATAASVASQAVDSGALAAINNFLASNPVAGMIIINLLFLWALVWKGYALWRAARLQQKFWFVLIMIVGNTFGLLEIAYVLYICKYDWAGLSRKLGLDQYWRRFFPPKQG